MDPLDAIRATFFEECGELLESLEAGLLALQEGTQGDDTVNAVFRSVHSIKGGAGAFDLGAIVAYSHHFESALAALRAGHLAADAETIAILLRACDRLGDIVAAARNGGPDVEADPGELLPLATGFGPGHLASGAEASGTTGIAPDGKAIASGTAEPGWKIAFEPLPDLLESGNEPLHLFRALEVLGEIEVVAIDADLPSLEDMDVARPRLRWEISLRPSAPDLTETEIEAVFEFALNLCILNIWRQSLPVASARSDTRRTVSSAPDPRPVGSVPGRAAGPDTLANSIRVDLGRVDRLVDLVGELVICQSMLAQGMGHAGLDQHAEAGQRLEELQQLTRDMQDSVMAIRAQPIRSLFQRMTRILREAAQATGKSVILETDGEATEIDKTVIERLADPLTHMIRNAVDHGIEAPDVRHALGKSGTGTIRLSARQKSDRVVIEVTDDGRGIDRARILERAISRGLVPPDCLLEESEIDRLMFLPGFSTSTEVSALSGRGVGLDVVQRAVRDLSGTVSVTSTKGRGCSISVSLPLTLAILEGMIVRSQSQRIVLPLSAIIETQTLEAVRFDVLAGDRRVVRLGERIVPYVDLASGLGFAPADAACGEDAAIIFLRPDEGSPFALRVDGIEMQRQVVIKGLADNFGHVPCVSAATILGDGQVALIVDPVGLASMAGLNRAVQTAFVPEMT